MRQEPQYVPIFQDATKMNFQMLSMTGLGSEATRRSKSMENGELVRAEAGKASRVLTIKNDNGSDKALGVMSMRGIPRIKVEDRTLTYQQVVVGLFLHGFDRKI